jgi:integrase
MKEGLALSNPIVNTNKREERARDRILSNDELRCIWNAAGDDAQAGASLHAYGTIVKLLILTGQRRSEIAEMRWSEVDLERCTLNLPAERTKNKRPHVVPLAPTALALLAGRKGASERVFDFSAWAYSKDLLDKHSGKRLGYSRPAPHRRDWHGRHRHPAAHYRSGAEPRQRA